MKSFEYSGVWWLPDEAEHRVTGTVTFAEQDLLHLALDGLLERGRDYLKAQAFKQYPVILGMTDDAKAITLYDCREIEYSISFGDRKGKQRCVAETAYLGAHFTDPHTIRFHAMDLYYSHLPQWAGVFPYHGFQKPVNEVKASTSKGTITIQGMSRLENEHDWIEEADLPESVWMRIETPETLSLQEWSSQFITPLQHFLNLVTQRANALAGIKAYAKPEGISQAGTDGSETLVQVVFPPAFPPIAPSQAVFPETILIPLNEVADNLSRLLEVWFKVAEELDSVCNLFFGVQYTKLYLSQRFLFIAQAAESYQNRRSTGRRYLPDEAEYQELIAVILSGCPEEHRAWLQEQLKYSNKATFRQKMKDLVRAAGPLLEQLIGKGSKARDNFAEVVFDTRNYLTHYDRELELKAARGDQLFFITNFISIALQVALFSELGFTLEQCVEIFRKHELYGFLLGQQPYIR